MKRFYCTICKKVKRVQNYPSRISGLNPLQPNPTNRIGQCNYHKLEQHAKGYGMSNRKFNELVGSGVK